MDRRRFLGMSAGVSAALLAADSLRAAVLDMSEAEQHQRTAAKIRQQAAASQLTVRPSEQVTNGDEQRYPDKRASFSKTLPHNDLGEVVPAAYNKLVDALMRGDPDSLRGLRSPKAEVRLANPMAAYAYDLAGVDAHSTAIGMPPPFEGHGTASEMGELYWLALTADVPYREYESDGLIAAAIADLNALSGPIGPTVSGHLLPGTLFRGTTKGDLIGPHLSQFLWREVPLGSTELDQRARYPVPGQSFLVDYQEWLACQEGVKPKRRLVLDTQPHYLRSNRDLAEYVRRIFNIQPYLNAALVALGFGDDALSPVNPYRGSLTESGGLTFGLENIVSLLGQAALIAEKAAWYQKWLVHRRLRPEASGARVHNQLTGRKSYDILPELLNSDAVHRLKAANGTALLPLAYPGGSPAHPSYPSAHATVAGACATVLKAFLNEDFLIPDPVQASATGLRLESWTGAGLTLGNEINKLASNVSLGRNAAGVHYRSDSLQGLRLGEEHAIRLLCDYSRTYPEHFEGFVLTRLTGKRIRITNGEVQESWQ